MPETTVENVRWKLSTLLLRMLLHKTACGGLVPKTRLLTRFSALSNGDWDNCLRAFDQFRPVETLQHPFSHHRSAGGSRRTIGAFGGDVTQEHSLLIVRTRRGAIALRQRDLPTLLVDASGVERNAARHPAVESGEIGACATCGMACGKTGVARNAIVAIPPHGNPNLVESSEHKPIDCVLQIASAGRRLERTRTAPICATSKPFI